MVRVMDKEPDWAALISIAVEASDLRAEGRWTRAEYDRLIKDATAAAPGFPQALEFLVNEADASWVGL